MRLHPHSRQVVSESAPIYNARLRATRRNIFPSARAVSPTESVFIRKTTLTRCRLGGFKMNMRFAALPVVFLLLLTCGSQLAMAGNGPSPSHNGHGDSKLALRQSAAPLFWKGSVGPEDAPTGGEPPECATVPCDHFRLKIDLPFGTFNPRTGRAACRWRCAGSAIPAGHTLPPGVPGCCGEFDTLHLWVYKDGALVAASPASSPYRNPLSCPSRTTAGTTCGSPTTPPTTSRPRVEYEALAEVEYLPRVYPVQTPAARPRCSAAPSASRFDTPSFPIFEPDPPAGASCFNSESARRRRADLPALRPDHRQRRHGPVEIAYQVPAGATPRLKTCRFRSRSASTTATARSSIGLAAP